eukprot:TRINITY_DN1615_c0_g1_i7.p1 TRINITY_DN1615_c0_g1~~TRINITY_DN1615_c0_g1_i7.p1  ORF type:complete len:217 (-),score=38.12 TRINITY_DN1615_c0_g1_i7:52-702(-)
MLPPNASTPLTLNPTNGLHPEMMQNQQPLLPPPIQMGGGLDSRLSMKLPPGFPPEDNNFAYYHEYSRIFPTNVLLQTQMRGLLSEKAELMMKLSQLEKKTNELTGKTSGQFELVQTKKKRIRRMANQIDRLHKCPCAPCPKSYGSEGSLHQHLRLKHNDYFVTHILNGKASKDSKQLDGDESIDRDNDEIKEEKTCLLYTSPSPRDRQKSRMPSSA